jgi:ATPase subunit of ABC transporter with duplicated ATPase domains
MGAVDVNGVGYALPGGRMLLDDVVLRAGDGEHVALIGANGSGKTTLLRIIAGELRAQRGSVAVDGRLLVMRQLLGLDDATVRDLFVGLAPPAQRAAAVELAEAEAAAASDASAKVGMRLARAHAAWGDAGGYEAEVAWDVCTSRVLGLSYDEVADRRLATLSGGEQKRVALETLIRSDADVLVLDEPDNFLDVPGKQWLEETIAGSPKTILFVSHDRELLARVADKIVTIEAGGSWTHGGGFAGYHEAREARIARFDELHRRHSEEQKRLAETLTEFRRRAQMGSDTFASRVRATKHRIERFEREPPPARPAVQNVAMRLGGARTGKRVVTVEGLELEGLTDPFDTEVLFGERIGVVGLNGTGKSHFLKLLAGHDIAHRGVVKLGARVVPGYFSQLHEPTRTRPGTGGADAGVGGSESRNDPFLLELMMQAGHSRGEAMASLRRYELNECADQPFETLSGGQQARLQILLLETSGATLLLLDEPTDNLDLVSSEALEGALEQFEGTVIAVTHDRWLMRSFDRFLVFGSDCTVRESPEPQYR